METHYFRLKNNKLIDDFMTRAFWFKNMRNLSEKYK